MSCFISKPRDKLKKPRCSPLHVEQPSKENEGIIFCAAWHLWPDGISELSGADTEVELNR